MELSFPRVLSRDCPNHPNGIYNQLSLPPSAVKILLCLLLIGFISVYRIGLVGDLVINIPECIEVLHVMSSKGLNLLILN